MADTPAASARSRSGWVAPALMTAPAGAGAVSLRLVTYGRIESYRSGGWRTACQHLSAEAVRRGLNHSIDLILVVLVDEETL